MSNTNQHNPKGRLLWCDAEANCRYLSSNAGVTDLVEKADRANINTVIVDVKTLAGEVLYKSNFAPRLGEVEGWRYPESFDLLSAMVDECHKKNLPVHAALNIFSEGNRQWKRGPAYTHHEWQVVSYEAVYILKIRGKASIQVELVNPWVENGTPAIYTRKSGRTIRTKPERRYAVIDGDVISAVIDEQDKEVSVPEDGCILSLPSTFGNYSLDEGDKIEWETEPVFRTAASSQIPSWGLFTNPIGPAREYELKILEEIVTSYDIDGIVFDRMRYPNLFADFSESSRLAFESWLGKGSIEWPEDIFILNPHPWLPPSWGAYYKEWLEWRASQILSFAEEATRMIRTIRPKLKIGVYVGSWYESYYDVGVNWGSCDFHPGYEWMTPSYNRCGFAHLFDYICAGSYYPHPTRVSALDAGRSEGASVEAACQVSTQAIGDVSIVYGSIYLRDYNGNTDGFKEAVQVATRETSGVMLFDLVYLNDYGWWPLLEGLFPEKTMVPHDSKSK